MNKRISAKILSLVLCIALLITCMPLAFAAKSNTFSVATVNDIHYYADILAGDKQDAFYTYLESHNCVYDDLDAILDAAFESLEYEVKNNGVKYIVLVGDLTTNGEYEGHEELAKKLLAFEEKTGAVILVTPGNHDINNPRASKFTNNVREDGRITTPPEFYEIYKNLGFSDAYHKFSDFTANTAGSLTYSVKTNDGYRLILADGGKFTPDATESGEAKQETAGKFSPELLEWIIAEAKDAKENGETPLLFTHWNMSGMNYFHEFLMQGFVIDDGYMLQEILADAGINYSFGGHQHVSDVSITYSDSGNPMYSVITPTLTQFPFSYRVTDFKKNSDGGLDVTFNQKSCDEYSGVKAISGYGNYPTPYKTTGFAKQHGKYADVSNYVFGILKKTLDTYINGIRAEGSIVKYVEKEMDINIEETVNKYLFGGIIVDNTSILSGKNVMSFLNDLDSQLMTKYIYNKTETYALIKTALDNIINTQISDIPCTKYIDMYGFGDTEKGGTLGDAVLTVIATMYNGNEDISDDEFAKDFIEFTGKTEFIELLLSLVRKYVVEDILVDNILANIDLNLDTLFVDEATDVGDFVQMFFMAVISMLDSGITGNGEKALMDALADVLRNFGDVSLKRIVEAVLGTGLIPYGSTIDELVDSLIDMFLPAATKETAVYQAKIVIGGMVSDDTKDWDVTYTNNGPVDVIPTKEDMQLPVNVTITPTKDNSTSFTINWFTKYSVTGTDITVKTADGKAVNDLKTEVYSEESTYTAPGFDAGTFGILPYTLKVIKHTATVTGLKPDTEYKISFGDKEKGFMSESTVTTAPEKGEKITFIHVSDTKGYIPSHFEGFSLVMEEAQKLYPDYNFLVHTGSLTATPTNDDQWSFAINAAEKHFSAKMTAYAAGAADNEGDGAAYKYFTVAHAPTQAVQSGTYYSYDYSDAHFAVLNTNLLTSGGLLSKEQTNWLKADLRNSSAKWNILVMNQSIYGAAASEALREQLLGIMEEFDIDLILQGSEDIYARTEYLRDDAPVLCNTKNVTVNGVSYEAYCDAKGTVAVISGSTNHFPEGNSPEGINFAKTLKYDLPMFSAITIDGDTLAVSAYVVDKNGSEQVDSFAINKSETAIRLGDVNLDGKVSSADARLALRYSVGLEDEFAPENKVAANADLRNGVTASDARLILRASVELEAIVPEFVFVTEKELNELQY